jgi:hypothetical protein
VAELLLDVGMGRTRQDGEAFVVEYDRSTALCTVPLTLTSVWSLAAHLYVVYVNIRRIRYLMPIVRRLHLSPCCLSWTIIFCHNGNNLETKTVFPPPKKSMNKNKKKTRAIIHDHKHYMRPNLYKPNPGRLYLTPHRDLCSEQRRARPWRARTARGW